MPGRSCTLDRHFTCGAWIRGRGLGAQSNSAAPLHAHPHLSLLSTSASLCVWRGRLAAGAGPPPRPRRPRPRPQDRIMDGGGGGGGRDATGAANGSAGTCGIAACACCWLGASCGAAAGVPGESSREASTGRPGSSSCPLLKRERWGVWWVAGGASGGPSLAAPADFREPGVAGSPASLRPKMPPNISDNIDLNGVSAIIMSGGALPVGHPRCVPCRSFAGVGPLCTHTHAHRPLHRAI